MRSVDDLFGEFDLTYSVQALKQMEAMRGETIGELGCVSNGHVAMVAVYPNRGPFRQALQPCRDAGLFCWSNQATAEIWSTPCLCQ